MKRPARLGLAALLLLALHLRVPVAHAAVDEYLTMDVASEEEDDENLLDHYLSRPSVRWRDEWERSANALRLSQGCLTAGIWYQANDFKSRSPIAGHAWLDFSFHQTEDDEVRYQQLTLDFRFPTDHYGTFGVRFRPNFDKSEQDFAALWNHGTLDSPLQIEAAFTFKDMFNSFWEFRQSRVGDHAEPYRAHPFEPSLRVVSRSAHHRVELAGSWLTPARKQIFDPDPTLDGRESFWGLRTNMSAVGMLGAWEGEVRGGNDQVLSAREITALAGDGRVYRRRWSGEGAVRRHLPHRITAEVRGVYQDRTQDWRPPAADAAFRALDRMWIGEVNGIVRDDIFWRVGLMYNKIGIAGTGRAPYFSYGSRKESRAFVGLQARFGRVRVQGIEGIELDHEPYDVTFHHDKGFLSLQTTF